MGMWYRGEHSGGGGGQVMSAVMMSLSVVVTSGCSQCHPLRAACTVGRPGCHV